MGRRPGFRSCLAVGLVCSALIGPAAGTPVPGPSTVLVDPATSRIGFDVWTRYGQRLEGVIPTFQGRVERLPDGQERFVVQLHMASATMVGHPRFTRWMRGPDFFDVAQYPLAVFESVPGPPLPVGAAADVDGWLTLRGQRLPLRLRVQPAGCARPGYDCAVTGRGEVSRLAYGMERWQLAVSDRVTFVLQVRLKGAESR